MSNHLHVVVQILLELALGWSDPEVAKRWVQLFPRPGQLPGLRASLMDQELLKARKAVYEFARQAHPNRWSKHTRNRHYETAVHLNPNSPELKEQNATLKAA